MIRELILLISVRVHRIALVHSLFNRTQIQAQWNSFVLQVEGWLCMLQYEALGRLHRYGRQLVRWQLMILTSL